MFKNTFPFFSAKVVTLLFGLSFCVFSSLRAQERPLSIEKINSHLYLYTTYNTFEGTKYAANAVYLITKKGVILFDTPWDSTQYQPLLDSIKQKHQLPVIAVYATHWHEDRAGGFAYYNRIGIPTYATKMTNDLLKENNKAQATHLVKINNTYKIGGQSFVLNFFGAGHSLDNVVVWFPDYQILDGGCFIKSSEAKNLGFIGDGDVKAWKPALARLSAKYPQIKMVIPGHDEWRDNQQIKRTEELLTDKQ
ncbi:BlaB/IND/MUS family subclass B1 metallo-beta-lactamase [Sphingobacterium sp. HMA12]|jgi:glyoxylase-like metal-dependent hydrolase (beta-lactamase superfamily II)|uniref:BlaB/IND/MUS family subclass B1 metallo-beta-lactamase n=1 Tax=Sphingobacterium sp. HMA12 TaxID=2050894 RepID=UPI000CEA3717|nr:BlaB/IND/MUS family subclass B1 metallo-beta-lactamase [Sphingobacterium sp. HMA12]